MALSVSPLPPLYCLSFGSGQCVIIEIHLYYFIKPTISADCWICGQGVSLILGSISTTSENSGIVFFTSIPLVFPVRPKKSRRRSRRAADPQPKRVRGTVPPKRRARLPASLACTVSHSSAGYATFLQLSGLVFLRRTTHEFYCCTYTYTMSILSQ